jgi:MFS family permease
VKEKSVKASQLIKVPRFAFGLISQILIYGTITSLQPTLALHLETFGYTAVFIGFSFAIPTLIYAATSPLIYILTSRFSKGAVILLGYLLTSLGMFLVGTSKLLGMYNSPAFIILGLAIMGFGAGMIIIPVLPDMIESLEEHSNLSAAQHD